MHIHHQPLECQGIHRTECHAGSTAEAAILIDVEEMAWDSPHETPKRATLK